MTKTILITGATSGIGRETAIALAKQGHHLLLHGRNVAKLDAIQRELAPFTTVECFAADLSRLSEVHALASAVAERDGGLDVLINNAGILKTPNPVTPDGCDVRFVVNTVAPFILAQRLSPVLGGNGRIVNLSSAAQHPVQLAALTGRALLTDFDAYAQSKLALTMWSCELGRALGDTGPMQVAVNPGSLLGTKMVKQGFGMAGKDVQIGVDILVRAALSDEFEGRTGAYFDNDAGRFAPPHPDALDSAKCRAVIEAVEGLART